MSQPDPPITPSIELLVKLAQDILHPEQFMHSVTTEVYDRARKALGLPVRTTNSPKPAEGK
jgi:hypothetical protein